MQSTATSRTRSTSWPAFFASSKGTGTFRCSAATRPISARTTSAICSPSSLRVWPRTHEASLLEGFGRHCHIFGTDRLLLQPFPASTERCLGSSVRYPNAGVLGRDSRAHAERLARRRHDGRRRLPPSDDGRAERAN